MYPAAVEAATVPVLLHAGACVAFVYDRRDQFGEFRTRALHKLGVAAWWGAAAPAPWEVPVSAGVALLVLDGASLRLTGPVALSHRLFFVRDSAADVLRVRWQVDTRLRWLDELPGVHARYAERRREPTAGRKL